MGPFRRKIDDWDIPRSLEKPPKLVYYDITWNPKEHVKHVDNSLDYHQVRGVVKCKLSLLTLKEATMT